MVGGRRRIVMRDDILAVADDLVGVAADEMLMRKHVRVVRFVHQNLVLQPVRHIEHGRKLLVFDLDQRRRGACLFVGFGSDERNCVAEKMRDFPDRNHHVVVLLEMPDLDRSGDVLGGQYAHDAGCRLCRRRIDRQHAGARIRAAHRRAVQHAVQIQIVRVFRVAERFSRRIDAVEVLSHDALEHPMRDVLTAAEHPRRQKDRFFDLLIAGAAADVHADRVLDLRRRRIGIAVNEPLCRHHHAGRAEAALHGARLGERIGVDCALARRESFAGDDVFALHAIGLLYTRLGRLAVDQHGTGAARALRTAVFDACQMQIIAQKADQFLVFGTADRLSVDDKARHMLSFRRSADQVMIRLPNRFDQRFRVGIDRVAIEIDRSDAVEPQLDDAFRKRKEALVF